MQSQILVFFYLFSKTSFGMLCALQSAQLSCAPEKIRKTKLFFFEYVVHWRWYYFIVIKHQTNTPLVLNPLGSSTGLIQNKSTFWDPGGQIYCKIFISLQFIKVFFLPRLYVDFWLSHTDWIWTWMTKSPGVTFDNGLIFEKNELKYKRKNLVGVTWGLD